MPIKTLDSISNSMEKGCRGSGYNFYAQNPNSYPSKNSLKTFFKGVFSKSVNGCIMSLTEAVNGGAS